MIAKVAKIVAVLGTGIAGFFAIFLFAGWFALIAILIGMAIGLQFIGWWWERNVKRPFIKSKPLVSILIPAWKSAKYIKKTLTSVQALNWPKKEIIVVNDSQDSTAKICRQFGIRCIQNKRRVGKAVSLNKAAKLAKGKILFFVDSDTVLQPDCLDKIIPWFSKQKIAAVMPRYKALNSSFVAKLVSIEHTFLHSFFKSHMAFGSLISFRGCAVAIRKDVFFKYGGWPETLIEDTDLAALFVSKGYKIVYEPKAIVATKEPDSFGQLAKQRYRWGKGAAFSWTHYRKFYVKNPQFLINFLPYLLLILATSAFVSFKLAYILPALAFLAYAYSLKEIIFISSLLLLPIFANLFASTATAAISHITLLTIPNHKNILLIFPYIFIFLPWIMAFYFKGILAGIRDRRAGRPELDLKSW
jgi:cellulose synthase/poly-beta-1,6-N-acetylglucosamine synthase-like glycosyltransferase